MIFKRNFLSYSVWILLGIFILVYIFTKFLSVSLPPKIIASQPNAIESKISSEEIVVRGLVKRTYFLKINKELIPFDEKGNFEKKISLQQGVNFLNIEAESRFGKKSIKNFIILRVNQ
jgi:hypothetical protein